MASNSASTVTVGTAKAEPGTLIRGAIPVTKLAGGSALEIPVIVINGAKPGPCLWIDASIHGDEPEGTFTCQTLARQVSPQQLTGTLVLVPAMNVPAHEAGQRGNPLDTFSYDMNRIYPGRADGYLTERMAWAHAEWMKKVADLEISIHSGGAHSYLSETIFVNEDDKSVELAKAMGRGWENVLSAISPKGNPMAVMLDAGKTGITVELGGRAATSPEEMRRVVGSLVEAMLNVMRHYGMMEGQAHYPAMRWKGFPCGGWAPGDRMAEDGVISERYPLMALPKGGYRQRTWQNVVDSDGTAIIYRESLTGGTRLTRNLCALEKKPCVLVDAQKLSVEEAVRAVVGLVEDHRIAVLNVAGPRASGWAEGYGFTLAVIGKVIDAARRSDPRDGCSEAR